MSLCILGNGEVVPIPKTPRLSFTPPKKFVSLRKAGVLTKQAFDGFIFFQFRCLLSKLTFKFRNLLLDTNYYKIRNITIFIR